MTEEQNELEKLIKSFSDKDQEEMDKALRDSRQKEIEHQLRYAKYDLLEKIIGCPLEATMCRHKEEYLKSLKRKYNVSDDKELFAKMNYEEKFEYIKKLGEIDKAHDRLFKIYDEESERINKKYGK